MRLVVGEEFSSNSVQDCLIPPEISTDVDCQQNEQLKPTALAIDFNSLFPSRNVVVRRHSISLCNRTPPRKSLAADILGSCNSLSDTSKSILTNMVDLEEALSVSDFNSAKEDLSGASDDNMEQPNDRSPSTKSPGSKHLKKKKRKLEGSSPDQNGTMKKKDLRSSPTGVV